MRRFHIALAVADLADSIRDYSRRLGAAPTAVVTGKYAMWRTDQLNFSINQMPERAGQLRHLGFEDEEAAYFYLFGVLAAEAIRSGRLGPNGPARGLPYEI